MTQATQKVDPFPAAALADNQAGRLTKDQRRGFSNLEKSVRWDRFTFAVILGVMGALVFTATGPAPNAQYRPLIGAAFFAVAAVLLFLAVGYPDALTRDLRAGQVESVEGPIGKDTVDVPGSQTSSTIYYLEVGKRRFEVHSLTYESAPDAGWVRLYYLPRSHKVVNLERLPDHPVPESAMSSPTSMAASMLTALRSRDQERINEARAEGQAMMHQFEAMRAQPTLRPADGNGGAPLAQAIVGSWSFGPMSITFRADGSMVAGIPGRQQHGHWSVDSSGKLHSDAMGRDQAADAWISGDTLTISDGEDAPVAFRRAAG
jgi:hypothetical protein